VLSISSLGIYRPRLRVSGPTNHTLSGSTYGLVMNSSWEALNVEFVAFCLNATGGGAGHR